MKMEVSHCQKHTAEHEYQAQPYCCRFCLGFSGYSRQIKIPVFQGTGAAADYNNNQSGSVKSPEARVTAAAQVGKAAPFWQVQSFPTF